MIEDENERINNNEYSSQNDGTDLKPYYSTLDYDGEADAIYGTENEVTVLQCEVPMTHVTEGKLNCDKNVVNCPS